jgi:hypothetical protein
MTFFLAGRYGRGAAVAYYLNREILWLGDGPSRYYDPLSRVRLLGNWGHAFGFYSEVGVFGWLFSVLFFLLIAFPGQDGKFRLRWVPVLLFLAIQALSFTTQIMNDISIVLAYCIFAKTYLVPLRRTLAAESLDRTASAIQ